MMPLGSLQRLANTLPDTDTGFFLSTMAPAVFFIGCLAGKHGVVGLLLGYTLGQFAGRHVPIGDVTFVTAGGFRTGE